MKLITKEIEKRLEKYPIYSQDGKGDAAKVILKIFNPYGVGTWLITEGEKQDGGDWLLYGYCESVYGWEWAYLTLSELERARVNLHGYLMPLEREKWQSNGKYTVGELTA
jgi:hypothetical protein